LVPVGLGPAPSLTGVLLPPASIERTPDRRQQRTIGQQSWYDWDRIVGTTTMSRPNGLIKEP
jgi:hypothetical protein